MKQICVLLKVQFSALKTEERDTSEAFVPPTELRGITSQKTNLQKANHFYIYAV
jgi:hypothetical protein